jgi:hypothetical protein
VSTPGGASGVRRRRRFWEETECHAVGSNGTGKNDDDGKKLKTTEALYMYRELI